MKIKDIDMRKTILIPYLRKTFNDIVGETDDK